MSSSSNIQPEQHTETMTPGIINNWKFLFNHLVLQPKSTQNDQPLSVVCQFMPMCKDVPKYIEFFNLDTAFDFQFQLKIAVVRGTSVHLYTYLLKIFTGCVYLQHSLRRSFWHLISLMSLMSDVLVFSSNTNIFPTNTVATFFLLQ